MVGTGAGWNEPEYEAIGMPFDPPGTRIERMTEAIAILRGLFGDGPFSFEGRFCSISELDGQPKPYQRPHPPFLVGGTRERVLRLAAREGDIVGLDLRQGRDSLPDAFPARMDELRISLKWPCQSARNGHPGSGFWPPPRRPRQRPTRGVRVIP